MQPALAPKQNAIEFRIFGDADGNVLKEEFVNRQVCIVKKAGIGPPPLLRLVGFGLCAGVVTGSIAAVDLFPMSTQIGAALGGIGDEESGGTILTTTSSASAKQAEKLINSGTDNVSVESWADADAIRRNLIEGQGYRNSTGYTGRQVRNNPDIFPEGKARTFHWDYADTQHGGRPHLQLHTPEGRVIRIFFEKGAGIPIRTPTGKR